MFDQNTFRTAAFREMGITDTGHSIQALRHAGFPAAAKCIEDGVYLSEADLVGMPAIVVETIRAYRVELVVDHVVESVEVGSAMEGRSVADAILHHYGATVIDHDLADRILDEHRPDNSADDLDADRPARGGGGRHRRPAQRDDRRRPRCRSLTSPGRARWPALFPEGRCGDPPARGQP